VINRITLDETSWVEYVAAWQSSRSPGPLPQPSVHSPSRPHFPGIARAARRTHRMHARLSGARVKPAHAPSAARPRRPCQRSTVRGET
jgi:hypothetical protein